MDNNTTFESAEQMAGWIGFGGKFGWAMKPQMVYGADGARLEHFNFHYPIGNLPDNWCPFQELISNANQAFISACNEADEEKMGHFDGMKKALIEAKKQHLKSIDPRMKGDANV